MVLLAADQFVAFVVVVVVIVVVVVVVRQLHLLVAVLCTYHCSLCCLVLVFCIAAAVHLRHWRSQACHAAHHRLAAFERQPFLFRVTAFCLATCENHQKFLRMGPESEQILVPIKTFVYKTEGSCPVELRPPWSLWGWPGGPRTQFMTMQRLQQIFGPQRCLCVMQYRTTVAKMLAKQANDPRNPAQFIITTFHPQIIHETDKVYGVSHQNRISR